MLNAEGAEEEPCTSSDEVIETSGKRRLRVCVCVVTHKSGWYITTVMAAAFNPHREVGTPLELD